MGIFASTATKSYDPVKEIPDLSGKVILITGGNAGIGASITKALASHNAASIYIAARTKNTAEQLIREIKEANPGIKTKLEVISLDLSSLDSVKTCAAEFKAKEKRLDLLFLNAGISSTVPGTTKDGYEIQFGINHVGHALLTQLLLPTILATPSDDKRIILTSSVGASHFAPKGGLALEKMKGPAEDMGPLIKYGHSKLANMLFALSLAKHYPSILSTAHHPGTVMSEIWNKATGVPIIGYLLWPFVVATGISTDEGAKTALWCATAKKEGIENGLYYEPVGKKDKLEAKGPHGKDEKLAAKLWDWTTEELEKQGGPGWVKA